MTNNRVITMKTKYKNLLSWLSVISIIIALPVHASLWDKIKKTTQDITKDVKEVASDVAEGVGETVTEVKEQVEPGLHYKGYSEDFKVIRELMYKGENQQVLSIYNDAKAGKIQPEDGLFPQIDFNSESLSVLNRLEYAILSLDIGKPIIAQTQILEARTILDTPVTKSESEQATKQAAVLAEEFLSGNEELQPYQPTGYEKVLILNYQALSYMLNGNEKAYNVTRAAIDMQNQELQAFRDKMAELEKEIATKKEETFMGIEMPDVSTLFDDFYQKYDQQAETVASAYVNPFASYLSAAVMEFDAYTNPSSVDDTQRSYKKALKLNPNSDILQKAIQDMERVERAQHGKMNPNERLLHLVVADGFAPEKKVAVNLLPIPNGIITIQHPIIEPLPSQVATVVIQDHKGKILAKSSKIADLSAIALRHQKDDAPNRNLRSLIAVSRSFVEQQALGALLPGSQLLGVLRDSYSHPDTRSWASLPSSFYGARLNLPKSIKKITISSYNAKNELLATTNLKLNKNHNFVYVRSIDDKINAITSKPLWMDKTNQNTDSETKKLAQGQKTKEKV